MQTIERILMVDGCVGTWTDAYGKDLDADRKSTRLNSSHRT